MKITNAYELQAKFQAGLQIVGEEDNELQWMGTDENWRKAERLETLIRISENI